MKKQVILPVALSVALAVSLGLNVYQRRSEQQLRTQIVGIRQRALLEAVDALQDVEVRLSKLMVSTGTAQSVILLPDTARQAGEAQQNLSQLPLRHAAVSDTMTFVNQLGDYARTLSERILGGAALSNQDAQQIASLLESCAQLNTQLAALSGSILDGTAVQDTQMWSDTVEAPAPLEQAAGSQNGIDYPSLIYDGPFSDGRHDATPRGLFGDEVTREEAREAVQRFIGAEKVSQIADAADSGGTIPAYGFQVTAGDTVLDVQVSRRGAQILFMMPENAAYPTQKSMEECIVAAYEFLTSREYGHMEPSFYQSYNGLAVINFAAVQDDVLLYPDLVKVQVRMDTAEVVGIEANNYLMNHVTRSSLTPSLTPEEAQSWVSEHLSIERVRLCLIPQESGERLCYEFSGTYAGMTYLVYIDANSGEQAEVLRIVDVDGARLTV